MEKKNIDFADRVFSIVTHLRSEMENMSSVSSFEDLLKTWDARWYRSYEKKINDIQCALFIRSKPTVASVIGTPFCVDDQSAFFTLEEQIEEAALFENALNEVAQHFQTKDSRIKLLKKGNVGDIEWDDNVMHSLTYICFAYENLCIGFQKIDSISYETLCLECVISLDISGEDIPFEVCVY